MDSMYAHLLLNYIQIIALLIGFIMLAIGFFKNQNILKITFYCYKNHYIPCLPNKRKAPKFLLKTRHKPRCNTRRASRKYFLRNDNFRHICPHFLVCPLQEFADYCYFSKRTYIYSFIY